MNATTLLNSLPKSAEKVTVVPDDCVTLQQIADATGAATSNVSAKLKRAGVVARVRVHDGTRRPPMNAFLIADVAKAYGVPDDDVSEKSEPAPKKKAPAEKTKTVNGVQVDGFGNPL